MSASIWQKCLNLLQEEYPAQQFNTWLRPLQAETQDSTLVLLAPNRFVVDWVKTHFNERINELVRQLFPDTITSVSIEIGTKAIPVEAQPQITTLVTSSGSAQTTNKAVVVDTHNHYLNKKFIFDSFVEGNSNQLARAAALQVAERPGDAYNPLFIYGGVGLGFAGKDRSQEEFFHTFNALLEGQQQIILTSDRYPKEIEGVEERLKSRFGWGLTVAVEPPELETRVAILISKAEQSNVVLPYEVAFFIAKRIRSNVRELEGALRRVIANAHFTGKSITIEFVSDALRDLLALQDKLVTIENIQKTVAEYYKVKVADLLSKRRSRSIARPRQMAMALAKELTNHSLPEIGDHYGGRDHTTVIHACRKVKDLISEGGDFAEDYKNLMRILSS